MWPCSTLIGVDGQLEPSTPIGPSIASAPDHRLPRWNVLEGLAAMLLLGAAVCALLVPLWSIAWQTN